MVVDFTISADFFNGNLSNWEALMDPWNCSLFVKKKEEDAPLSVEVNSAHKMELTVTHTLIETALMTSNLWMSDLYVLFIIYYYYYFHQKEEEKNIFFRIIFRLLEQIQEKDNHFPLIELKI